MQNWLMGVGLIAVSGAGFWALGKYGPGYLASKVHILFVKVKDSEWARNPLKPKRACWLLATVDMLEDELPEPGTGAEFYKVLGADVAEHFPPPLNNEAKWASTLEKFGDASNLELDAEIVEIAKLVKPEIPKQ